MSRAKPKRCIPSEALLLLHLPRSRSPLSRPRLLCFVVHRAKRCGNKLATVTATIVKIKISEHVFGSVYGEDGSNLDRI